MSLQEPTGGNAKTSARAPRATTNAAAPPATVRARSLEEQLQAGRALRDKVPRARHGPWKRPDHRPNPLDLLRAGDEGRVGQLVPIRYGRMLQSPFAFYRGSAAIMAADLATTPSTGLHVQACGDCHLMNFGGFATPERNIIFDINDFDETLPAPWEWDVKRLAASFVLAGRAIGLSDSKAKDAAVRAVRSYRTHLSEYAEMDPLDVWYARVTSDDVVGLLPHGERRRVQARIDKARKQNGSEVDFPKLAGMVGGRVGIRDVPPLIYHPEVAHTPDFEARVLRDLALYRETLAEDRRALLDEYSVVDSAMKVVGVGSVGRRCWIVLLMSASNAPLFLQLKEAVASVLEPYAGKSQYAHHGQRVVMGQRLMQPASDVFLGWVTDENGAQFYVRQLRDAKIKPLVETFDDELLSVMAESCGWTLARAHAKVGEAAPITGYLGSGPPFEEAVGDFAVAYADQAERDHGLLKAAVRRGDITAFQDI
jgi:uncharacterized protein (DUF2252 family)